MAKILLINPYGEIIYQGFRSSRFPSLSSGYVSTLLKQAGHVFTYYELRELTKEFGEILKKGNYDYVLINNQRFYTYFCFMFPVIVQIANYIKNILPKTIVCVADSQLVYYGELYIKEKTIDHFLISEVEYTFPYVVDLYEKKEEVAPLVEVPLLTDLDILPFPDTEIMLQVDNSGTPSRKFNNIKKGQMIISRGCSYSCEFCISPMLNKNRVRRRTAQSVLGEIEEYIKLGIRHFIFWDETFTLNHEYLLQLLEIFRNKNITWSCNTRIDMVNEQLLKKMSVVGCRSILFGIERFTSQQLNEVAPTKLFSLEKYQSIFSYLKTLNIESVASLIFGLEGDNYQTFKSELKLIQEIKPSYTYVRPAIPFPGTPLYVRLLKESKIPAIDQWIYTSYFRTEPYGFPLIVGELTREEFNFNLSKMRETLSIQE